MSDPAKVQAVIDAKVRDVGGHSVWRVLPALHTKALGPFVFLDHLASLEFGKGQGFDVRPHPHIGLCTVTTLFEGAAVHRDSLGFVQEILPGELNWMTAGRGIVHSERSPDALRASGGRLHGLQLWVALPLHSEECEPDFQHLAAEALPKLEIDGARLCVLAGSAYGVASPVKVPSPLFYVDVRLPEGGELVLPAEYAERGVYVVEGGVSVAGEAFQARQLLVFEGGHAEIRATESSHVVLLGGHALDAPRHVFWNFVSSSRERIEVAKQAWREQRFPTIPSDQDDFAPLPE